LALQYIAATVKESMWETGVNWRQLDTTHKSGCSGSMQGKPYITCGIASKLYTSDTTLGE